MTSAPVAAIPESAEGLVRRAVRGDQAAFARIVRLHHADMVRVCFVVAGDMDAAEEAVAAAWPIAWRRLGTLREPDRLRPVAVLRRGERGPPDPAAIPAPQRHGDPGHRRR